MKDLECCPVRVICFMKMKHLECRAVHVCVMKMKHLECCAVHVCFM